MSLVQLTAFAILGMVLWEGPLRSWRLAKTQVDSTLPGGNEDTFPTNFGTSIWVDRPVNTALRNDAVGNNPGQIQAWVKRTYATEAAVHPGVQLVANSGI